MYYCLSCDIKLNNNYKLHNGLYYCNNCYNNMLKIFNKYDKENEKNRKKIYFEPVHIINNIYIGNLDSVHYEKLKTIGITDIIICGKNLKNDIHSKFNNIEFLIDDSFEQQIIEHIKISNKYIDNNNNKILIHCYSGISRSSSFVIGYVMHYLNINFNEAYSYVKFKYPRAIPNDNFIEQLKNVNL